jgi:hypothetical protein
MSLKCSAWCFLRNLRSRWSEACMLPELDMLRSHRRPRACSSIVPLRSGLFQIQFHVGVAGPGRGKTAPFSLLRIRMRSRQKRAVFPPQPEIGLVPILTGFGSESTLTKLATLPETTREIHICGIVPSGNVARPNRLNPRFSRGKLLVSMSEWGNRPVKELATFPRQEGFGTVGRQRVQRSSR